MDRRGQQVLIHAWRGDWCGRIVAETDASVTLADAWKIGKVGWYGIAERTGRFEEMEPCPGKITLYISPGDVFVEWPLPLPKDK